jgi:hypothetical protein
MARPPIPPPAYPKSGFAISVIEEIKKLTGRIPSVKEATDPLKVTVQITLPSGYEYNVMQEGKTVRLGVYVFGGKYEWVTIPAYKDLYLYVRIFSPPFNLDVRTNHFIISNWSGDMYFLIEDYYKPFGEAPPLIMFALINKRVI